MPNLDLHSPIESLPRITKPQVAALKKFGLFTVKDLLFYIPFRYLDFSKTEDIKTLVPGQSVTVKGKIKAINSRFSFRAHLSLAEAIISDDTGSIKVTWFNQPYLKNTFKVGEEILLAGIPEYYKNSLQLTNPIYEKSSDHPIHTSRLVPVYRLPAAVYPKTFRNFISLSLGALSEVKDELPEPVRQNQELETLQKSLKSLHFPQNPSEVREAKKRLAFEEIFLNQLAAQKYKNELSQKKSIVLPFNQNLVKDFLVTLPFELTAGQKKAAWDVLQDLEKPVPMNRLLEGDVGSGKTLVAIIAALECIELETQVALLAPTEILARQHFETAKKYLNPKKVALLTSGYSEIGQDTIEKTKLLQLIKEGMPALYIGTHALFEDKIKFKNLSLTVIDEQHRFGVQQRSNLLKSGKKIPHLLSLTATPIPRTLQLAAFGELDISTIKTKPAGRLPIKTQLVTSGQRQAAYAFIAGQIKQGRQVFVITPLIEESDKLGVKAAKSEQVNLQQIFPDLKVALLHGRMKTKEKEQVMSDFLANKAHILVSTSVVEVGVDIPNASVMVIEGAERFGLAQLHQFRGRVGRAQHQSYCFVFTENENPDVLERLQAFTKTLDGFALAELDLKLRGFGQLYGERQSGWDWKYFDLTYTDLIPPARKEAQNLLLEDPGLENYPQLLDKIRNFTIHLE